MDYSLDLSKVKYIRTVHKDAVAIWESAQAGDGDFPAIALRAHFPCGGHNERGNSAVNGARGCWVQGSGNDA